MAESVVFGASQSSLLLLQQKPSSLFATNSLLAPSSHQFSSSGLIRLRISLTRQGSNPGHVIAFSSGGGSGGGPVGGGGGGGRYGENGGEGEEEEEEKKTGMSMSQKLTLGYAALVAVGGVMGYLKSGSQKSLAAGGVSAALLYYVYSQLPSRPVFASSIGLGISAALLVVMGSRFKKSGKVFPAGVVSLVSLVMTGGYLHGILRSMH
ncbi:protein FATTY ACID EXPORT 7-like [Punica granatum]|uniref:Protein FATTY ACID EXPORT 7-like n=1 Tax=Punica granatum TaxID=22663 RepID=A0A6P8BWG2_PUNGR|nr:protein FATTY ACID EXPORT 7-like [Punica granatum]